MILDTSAIIVLIKGEPEAAAIAEAIEAAEAVYLSAATYLEAAIVTDGLRSPVASARFDEILTLPKISVEPFTLEQARIAREAYRNFGKGSGHPANLNFGDCFSYALARTRREPILYKGDDFRQTDLRSALKPS